MKKQYIIMDNFEFKAQTYYNVEVSVGFGNPIFQDIFYTGFLNGLNDAPGGYNKFFQANIEFKDVFYMRIISELDTKIDNQYGMVKDVLTEHYPEALI